MANEQSWTMTPPLSAADADVVERSMGLSLAAFPLLRAALEQGGNAFRNELLEFAEALHHKRAPRFRRSLIARVYTVYADVPDVAVVRDLSASGVRLWVDGDRPFDAAGSEPYVLEVRVPGSNEYVRLEARLVRVAENRGDRGVELAFTFTGGDDLGLQQLLSLVQHERRSAAKPAAQPARVPGEELDA